MNPTAETLQLAKDALGAPNVALLEDVLAKGITQATGLVAYDLQAPSLKLFPVLTPMRNETPRVKANGGTATNWKAVTGINTTNIFPGVGEGNRGAITVTSTANYVASYLGFGLEDYVTFEADYAAENFEDVKATAALDLLSSMMIQEEYLIYGGNNSLALGTATAPTLVGSTTGGTLATQTLSVIVVALTNDGYRRSSVSGGVPAAAIAKTNADGSTDNFNPGVGRKSTNTTASLTGPTASCTATTPVVRGAVAYAWYWGAAASETLGAITTINSVLITATATGSQLASALAAADLSQNAMAFDGYLTWGLQTTSGVYGVQATGTAGTGTALTSDGAAGIVEITSDFKTFWDNYRLSPDTIWCHSQEIQNISKKIIANGGAPLLRVTQAADGEHSGITGGVLVTGILNPFTGEMVKIRIHPYATPGTILYTSRKIPYKLSGVGNVSQMKMRREYYQLEWPVTKRKYEYGVYADGVLQVYAPFAFGARTNIANG